MASFLEGYGRKNARSGVPPLLVSVPLEPDTRESLRALILGVTFPLEAPSKKSQLHRRRKEMGCRLCSRPYLRWTFEQYVCVVELFCVVVYVLCVCLQAWQLPELGRSCTTLERRWQYGNVCHEPSAPHWPTKNHPEQRRLRWL